MSATPSRHRRASSGKARWPASNPGHQGTWVDYLNNARAPLLFIAGTEDHLMPAKIQWPKRQALHLRHRHRSRPGDPGYGHAGGAHPAGMWGSAFGGGGGDLQRPVLSVVANEVVEPSRKPLNSSRRRATVFDS